MERICDFITAKTSGQDKNLWLPLRWHLEDTANVMEYLCKEWVPPAFYDEIGLSRAEGRKYAHFLALAHDLGKATPAFQRKILQTLPDIKARLEQAGFPLIEVALDDDKFRHAHAGAVLLRSVGAVASVAAIVGAHHGKPESWDDLDFSDNFMDDRDFYGSSYGKQGSLWEEVQQAIIDWALAQSGYDELSDMPEISDTAQLLLTGLLVMADWISSNTNYFPLLPLDAESLAYDQKRLDRAVQKLCLPEPLYVRDYWLQSDFFMERFAFTENIVQKEAMRIASTMADPGIVILEAPMGVGKTEAALAAAEIMMNRFNLGGLAFFLPSQATSNAMFDRILQWLRQLPDPERVAVQLAHAQAALNDEFAELPLENVCMAPDINAEDKLIAHSFFRGRKTRLLANVVVGTIDQLLMAALKRKHIMLRHLGIAGKVVIIDECHAYDVYMSTYLDRVLTWLGAYNIPVILLSATLPGKRRAALMQAYAGKKRCVEQDIAISTAYPLLTWADKNSINLQPIVAEVEARQVLISKMTEEAIVDVVRSMLQQGGCVGIILNTVKRVQLTAETIMQQVPEAEVFIDHSQFVLPDRLAHERLIMRRIGRSSSLEERRKVVVIGTQVLEQSLDLDFDLLITDLCPMDLLLQRIGRLHRHVRVRPAGFEKAKCIVLHNDKDDLEAGAKAIYGEYILMQTAALLPAIISLPQDISLLVQAVYDEEAGSQRFPKEAAKFQDDSAKREDAAKTFRLQAPDISGEESIVGLLDDSISFTDPQAQAAVRDGASSLEVLVLAECSNGEAELLTAEGTAAVKYRMDCQLSLAEAREIAKQRLRLPARFAQSWCAEKNIELLEAQSHAKVAEWLQHPLLAGELILILDRQRNVVINNVKLHYDSDKGLLCEE